MSSREKRNNHIDDHQPRQKMTLSSSSYTQHHLDPVAPRRNKKMVPNSISMQKIVTENEIKNQKIDNFTSSMEGKLERRLYSKRENWVYSFYFSIQYAFVCCLISKPFSDLQQQEVKLASWNNLPNKKMTKIAIVPTLSIKVRGVKKPMMMKHRSTHTMKMTTNTSKMVMTMKIALLLPVFLMANNQSHIFRPHYR